MRTASLASGKNAFTLAETLITLVIIGIIAALTIPGVLSNYREKVTVTKLKKMYSILQEGFMLSSLEEGSPNEWGLTGRDIESALIIREKLFKNIKAVKKCDLTEERTECGLAETYIWTTGKADDFKDDVTSLLLTDGSSVMVIADNLPSSRGTGALANSYGIVYFDVNAAKEPNIYGKDFFTFILTETGIVPSGTEAEREGAYNVCKTTGGGCAAYVLLNETLNYDKL